MLPMYDRFEWAKNSREDFIASMLTNDTQEKISEYLFKTFESTDKSINRATDDLANILVDIGDSSLKRICRRKSKKKKKTQKLGFDDECYIF